MDKGDLPSQIGRYKLREQIAKGGMSKIYRAYDDIIGRDVAIKITDNNDPAWKNVDTHAVLRQFSMEAQISGQLSHHSFVTIYDAGTQGDLAYLVMELLNGKALSKVIKENQPDLNMKQKLDIIVQIARSLHHAHQRGIIHRDVKPSNIMLLKSGQAKLMDFGVSFVSEGSSVTLDHKPEAPNIGGTPYYMSPEQINKKPIDARSDLFSLAILSYELLTGKRPFRADKLFALYEKILKSEPEPIRNLLPSVPQKVEDLIIKSLRKNPEERFDSCEAFADSMDEVINELFCDENDALITEGTVEILQKYRESFSFFYDLDNQQIYKLLQVCSVKKYKAGETVFMEGAVARDMYLVMSGRLKVLRGQTLEQSYVVQELVRGDVFGEMGIIDGGPRSASVVADSDSQLLMVHQVSLHRCDDDTAGVLYKNLAQILSIKLRNTSERLDILTKGFMRTPPAI